MKRTLLVIAFFCFAGSVSSFACSHCEHEVNGYTCKGGDWSGNCGCTDVGRSSCSGCGFCYLFICVQKCDTTASNPESIIRVAMEPKKAPAGAYWLEYEALAEAIRSVSPTMASLVADEQPRLKKNWCANFRRGGVEDALKPNKSYRWEMFSLANGSTQYRIIETDEVLVMTGGYWVFEKKGKAVAGDTIPVPVEAALPPIVGGMAGF